MCGTRPSQERVKLMLEVDRVYCVCGAVMKKHYRPPVFRYLDFLGKRQQDALDVLAPDLVLQNVRKE